jgi:hypothetical protein
MTEKRLGYNFQALFQLSSSGEFLQKLRSMFIGGHISPQRVEIQSMKKLDSLHMNIMCH